MNEIENFMTRTPITIDESMTLKEARIMMEEHHIRHLPVRKKDILVGILSESDIKTAGCYLGSEAEVLRAKSAMTPVPFTVLPSAELANVVKHMAERKYGCVIVQEKDGKIVGILTALDALEILAETLNGIETAKTYNKPKFINGPFVMEP